MFGGATVEEVVVCGREGESDRKGEEREGDVEGEDSTSPAMSTHRRLIPNLVFHLMMKEEGGRGEDLRAGSGSSPHVSLHTSSAPFD